MEFRNICWLLLVLLAIVLIIFVDNIWSEQLYNKTIIAIHSLQSHSSKALDKFFIVVAALGMLPAFLIVSTLVYNYDDRHNWFFLNFSSFLAYSLTSILKLSYKAPRPYYVDTDIRAISCEAGYGKPSGHALECSQLFLTLWFIYMYHYSKAKLIRVITLMGSVLLIGLIMLDRLYLGVHSLDQVIMGAYLGSTIAISLNLLFYETIKRAYKLTVNREEGYRKYAFPCIIMMSSVHIFNIVMLVLNRNGNDRSLEAQWSPNIEAKCPRLPSTDLYSVHFVHLSFTTLFLGYFIAMLFSSRRYQQSVTSWQSETSIPKRIARLCLLLVLTFICFTPTIFYRPKNILVNAAICKFLPSVLMCLLYCFIDRIAEKLHLSSGTVNQKMEGINNIKDDENLGKAIDAHN